MKTESVLLTNLCVPCACRCRYCLLSWNGKPVGIPWERSCAFAERFIAEVQKEAPELRCDFSFGYSMEHPNLAETIRFLRRIGSPQAELLQCDGMRMRNAAECMELAGMLTAEGVKSLNFTFYGLPEYHDRFAARKGDFDLMIRMIQAAAAAGLQVSAGVPLTKENAAHAPELLRNLLEHGCERVRFFIPHEEGRGASLAAIRLEKKDLESLPEEVLQRLNRKVYRLEADWVREQDPMETRRMILVSFRQDNIDRYESMSAMDVIREIEELDDAYYATFPPFRELARQYGDANGERLYGYRDLFAHYRSLYAEDQGIRIYDVTDERQSGSRRY